ncbi:hypothetical protein V6N12_010064 [Hibiscus sabdariffa]|uniref:Uncharacterized protein n=1 Tax=Hibiscus sabdariffa TaxID=183260 RepID=A0ABR2ECK8_9ROSI
MPNYAKFLKDMMARKTMIGEFETAIANEACLKMMLKKVLAKRTDPGSLTIPCSIGNKYSGKTLCDPDRSYMQPEGKIEDILVLVDKFIFPVDFLILDCETDEHAPIILGRPFLATA